uniref:En-A3 pheromone n=1 Tax=Euplotes nobilii TaxID=184062 RepID=C4NXD7_EUPNO|nr:En-A3 pheromone precursor [Euplotes nobilii]
MTKLSIFVVIAMLVMVSSAFRFQSRMNAKTEDPEDDFTPGTCGYTDSTTAWNECTTGSNCGRLCCDNCFEAQSNGHYSCIVTATYSGFGCNM